MLKTFYKFLGRNKLFTVVNVAGLSISLMFVLLMTDVVVRQLSVDNYQENFDRMYLINTAEKSIDAHVLIGDKLKAKCPYIEDWCAVSATASGYTGVVLQHDGGKHRGNELIVTENFFEMFSFPLIEGDPKTVLDSKDKIVLSEGMALRMFGTTGIVGKQVVMLVGDTEVNYTISGVMKDIDNSIFPDAKIILPFDAMKYFNWHASLDDVNMNSFGNTQLFFLAHPETDMVAKSEGLQDILAEMLPFVWSKDGFMKVDTVRWMPVRDYYFSDMGEKNSKGYYTGSSVIVTIFIIAGVLVLLMAVCNYVSMSVAQTAYRAKEMATRRLLGSDKGDIFWRMITESFLLTSLSFVLAFLLAKAAEPIAAELTQEPIELVEHLSFEIVIAYVAFIFLLSFVAGFFPATIVSQYHPLDVVRGTFRRKTKMLYLRVLYIVQSGLSVAMLACAIFFAMLVRERINQPLGYTWNNLLCYELSALNQSQKLAFAEEVRKLPCVKYASLTSSTPFHGGWNNTPEFNVGDSTVTIPYQRFYCDTNFVKIFNIEVLDNRHIVHNSDNKDNMYIETGYLSESFYEKLGFPFDGDSKQSNQGLTIVPAGRHKDFVTGLNTQNPNATMIFEFSDILNVSNGMIVEMALVEFVDGDLAEYRQQADSVFAKIYQSEEFTSEWYDDVLFEPFQKIFRIEKLIFVFSGASFLISLLGLIAMSVYLISQRKRDIAIRKVFGSDTLGEMNKLMKFCFFSQLLGLVIAVPLTYFGSAPLPDIIGVENRLPLWQFLVAFATITVISLVSLAIISHRAMNENPVKNLKME